jgi:hypothetical protein
MKLSLSVYIRSALLINLALQISDRDQITVAIQNKFSIKVRQVITS